MEWLNRVFSLLFEIKLIKTWFRKQGQQMLKQTWGN